MSTIQSISAALQQEGYQPRASEGEALAFRYYGQDGQFRVRRVGAVEIGELECRLPRPSPTPEQTLAFGATHPLSRLSGREGRSVLTLETLITEGNATGTVQLMLGLLDQYVADIVFGLGMAVQAAEETPAPPQVAEGQPVLGPATPEVPPVPVEVHPPAAEARPPVQASNEVSQIPAGWEDFWSVMSARYHPLARALSRLNVPAPDEVQMDMVQGHQVRGTAIMMWGAPPNAVVVCEPGQPVPQGYQGSTWLKHLTVEQVARETQAHLRVAGRL